MSDTPAYAGNPVPTRLGRPAEKAVESLGPLADLVGTWIGTRGWELIAVPTHTNGFRLIVRPYVEIITFAALGAPVPNRGLHEDLFLAGLTYDVRIADLETNEPMHVENGMWLSIASGGPEQVARMAAVPHGDVFLALGSASSASGPPEIPTISGLPDTGPDMPLGYTDPYLEPHGEFQPGSPNAVLVSALSGLNVVNTTTLSVTTSADGGGGLDIPFITTNTPVNGFVSTYWIETIEEPGGEQVQQLQYSQQTNLNFIPKFGAPGEIMWPHVNVNTLRKQ